MARAAVRVALQSGATAVSSIIWSSIGVIFIAIGIGILASEHPNAFGLVPLGMGLLAFGLLAKQARNRRASDLVVDATALRIEGGSQNGRSFAWSDLAGARIEENRKEYVKTSTPFGEKVEYLNLLIFTDRTNIETTVAEALDPVEKSSLADIARAVKAAHDASAGPLPAPAKPIVPSVVYCTACGAPVAPADAAMVACHQCGAVVAMRGDLRQNIATAARVAMERSHVDALVAKLLDQPGANATNRRIAAFAALFLLSPIVFLTVIALALGKSAVMLYGAVICASWGFTSWAIADRLAVRALVMGFAARAPVAEGHPYGCRRCGGPLPPASDGRVVVACAYCRAENVIGLDAFAHDRTPDEHADLELGTALSSRSKERAWASLKLAAGVVLFIGGLATLAFAR